jgi:sigma-B regulation protein RsbU (phosphoserine phosphatase)
LQLDLPADANVLMPARRVVEALLDREEAGDAVDDVILAVDEACSNVIRHAFPAGDGSYSLSAEVDSDCIDLTVEDHGVGVDVDTIDLAAPIDWEATSGRGLGIIRQLMTSVEIESADAAGGTRLRMHKRFLS